MALLYISVWYNHSFIWAFVTSSYSMKKEILRTNTMTAVQRKSALEKQRYRMWQRGTPAQDGKLWGTVLTLEIPQL